MLLCNRPRDKQAFKKPEPKPFKQIVGMYHDGTFINLPKLIVLPHHNAVGVRAAVIVTTVDY